MAPELRSDTEKLKRRNYELSILNAIAEALNREVDLDRSLHTALAQVVDLFDLQTGWIWLLREATGEPYLAAAQNLPSGLAYPPQRMEGSCYCLDTFRAGDLNGAANVNVITCSRLKNLVDGTDGLRYHASIPLYAHGKKLGVLNVASSNWQELSPDDLRLLYTVGDLLGIAVERARLFAGSVELGAVEERNRLAREIHDTLAQGLAAITLQLETADVLLESGSDPARVRQVVNQALNLTRVNLEEARRSVLDLRAAPLEGQPLAVALRALVDEWSARWGIPVKFAVTGGSRPLSVRIEAGLYRIAQEALTNIARHACASNVSIELVTTLEQVTLAMEDDGRGFDPTQVPASSYGLIGLNERVKLLGGTLELQSWPGSGTALKISIPLITPITQPAVEDKQ
ncbi:MAG: GAF domain-containing sensor histidine kinase [Chloroflexi bacterium]|nr:GAF domain-containing sensor histidine kinase [Chloroflexota bacterium]